MGSGKTTAGKRLAQELGYQFLDLDALIENQEQKTIAQIFEDSGEQKFRKIEQSVLRSTFVLKNTVVSLGGGAPCFFNNMNDMNQHGYTVYIQLSPKSLVKRLAPAKAERPLIKDKSDKELLAFIENALQKREPFYNQAKITVNGIGLSAQRILMKLEKIKKV